MIGDGERKRTVIVHLSSIECLLRDTSRQTSRPLAPEWTGETAGEQHVIADKRWGRLFTLCFPGLWSFLSRAYARAQGKDICWGHRRCFSACTCILVRKYTHTHTPSINTQIHARIHTHTHMHPGSTPSYTHTPTWDCQPARVTKEKPGLQCPHQGGTWVTDRHLRIERKPSTSM